MSAVAESVAREELLTAAALVDALRERGRGEWDADTLRQWIRHPEHPCPAARLGKEGRPHLFRLADVEAWLDARETRAAMLADPKAELARQQARRARLDADRMEGLLIPATQIEPAMGRVVDVTRTSLLGLVQTLTDLLTLEDAQRVLVQREIDGVLAKLSRGIAERDQAEGDE